VTHARCQPPPDRTPGCLRPAVDPDVDAKVAFLSEARSYPEPTCRVDTLETHMSWVFLLDRFVYKLKKPVCCDLLDFRSLEARRYFCEEEARLNQRLAPGVYLGLVPLTLWRKRLELGGGGVVVDWLVRMRRLPADLMLDHAIRRQALSDTDLLRVARRLATFYLGLPAEPITREQYRARFERRLNAAARELSMEVFGLQSARIAKVREAQLATLRRIGPVLDSRVSAGLIVEGHGDLRPEHVYLGEPPAVIDCLEYARKLRVIDPADEVAYLALECERLGAPGAASALLCGYSLMCGDNPPPPLIHFYQSCRASTRALIAARHLLDGRFRHSERWRERAGAYLRLAQEHIGHCV